MAKKINKLKKDELLILVSELRKLNDENESFIETYLERDLDILVSLEKYKKQIAKAANHNPAFNYYDKGDDYDFEKCDKILKSYLSASNNNLECYAELLVYTIEQAHAITMEFGAIDEDYYCHIEEWYEKAAKSIVIISEKNGDIIDFIERLREVYHSADCIGWGYYNTLGDFYSEYLKDLIK